MKKAVLIAVLILFAAGWCLADDQMQITTTSWHGLSGLFVIPTARVIGPNKVAMGFNESKHTEFKGDGKFVDRQIRGVATYGIGDRFELTATDYNNMYHIADGFTPQLTNRPFSTVGFKYLILKEDERHWPPAVAVGVRDILNHTADIGPLSNVNNGRKFFLVASKRVCRNRPGGMVDLHVGLASDRTEGLSGFFGAEMSIAPNASLIAEGIWDGPYLNFQDFGKSNVGGRFLFNPGIRFYPRQVPGLALDMGFIGDSEFEFSFGASYAFKL